jgi:hypothetical protein
MSPDSWPTDYEGRLADTRDLSIMGRALRYPYFVAPLWNQAAGTSIAPPEFGINPSYRWGYSQYRVRVGWLTQCQNCGNPLVRLNPLGIAEPVDPGGLYHCPYDQGCGAIWTQLWEPYPRRQDYPSPQERDRRRREWLSQSQ